MCGQLTPIAWIAMDLDRPRNFLTSEEVSQVVNHLAKAKKYGDPRQVWVEDGHVFVEGHNGEIVSMTPAVAIKMGRMLGEAGASSLINQVMDESSKIGSEASTDLGQTNWRFRNKNGRVTGSDLYNLSSYLDVENRQKLRTARNAVESITNILTNRIVITDSSSLAMVC